MEEINQQSQSPQPVNPTPAFDKNPSKSKLIPIVLGVAAAIVIAIGAYLLGSKQTQPVAQNSVQTTPIPSPTPADETANWKMYSNTKYGYSFKYPQDSKMSTDESTIELPFNPGTNLTQKTLRINVKTSNSANCSNSPTQTREQPTTVRINNIEFKKDIGGDVGAGQIYDEFNYSTAKGSNCFGFSFVLHSSPPEMFSPVRPAFDREKEIKVFDQILATFKFTDQSQALDTASWKTYIDNKNGFSIKYPDNLNTRTQNVQGFLIIDIKDKQEWIEISTETLEPFDLNKEINDDLQRANPIKTTFHNKPAVSFRPARNIHPGEPFKALIVYLEEKKLEIRLEYFGDGKSETLFNQILSTFKFTENNIPISTNLQDEGSDGFVLSSPNGGEILKMGTTQKIKWNDSKGLSQKIAIFLQDTKSVPWKTVTIASSVSPSTSSYLWTVPNDDSIASGNTYKILITSSIKDSTKMGFTDETDGVFEISK